MAKYSQENIFDLIYSYQREPYDEQAIGNLLRCLRSLTPNQRYSYIQQANFHKKTARKFRYGGSCIENAVFWGHFDLLKCMLDVSSPEQRYDMLSTPSARGNAPLVQRVGCYYSLNMHDVLKYILDSLTSDLRYKLLQTQDVHKDCVLHGHFATCMVDNIRCVLGYLNGEEVFHLLQLRNSDNLTPLTCAVQHLYFEVCEEFLKRVTQEQRFFLLKNADVGRSVLHYFKFDGSGFVDLARYVLNSVPPEQQLELLSLPDRNGTTPPQMAQLKGLKRMLALYTEYLEKS